MLDEWAEREPQLQAAAAAHSGPPVTVLTGEGFAKVLGPLLRRSLPGGQVQLIAVHNEFFGGNVDVAGLLTAQDMVKALLDARPQGLVLVPAAAFNASQLTLDDQRLEDIVAARGCSLKASASVIDSLLEEL